jgi:hypothetical protein
MAQAGYTPISLYYSTTASASPSAGNLVAGELALNTLDEKLYFKNSTGSVKLLASVASTSNVSSITFGSTGLTPSTTTTGAVTVAGTLAIANGGTGSTSTTYCSLTTNVTGTLPIANGGTGSASTTYCNLASNVTGTLPVANGGTGVASTTAYAVLCGGTTTTGPFQAIASVGTTGQILTSNGAGALPTFQTLATSAFPSGTVMLFAQTAAPTGWTKNTTTGDNSALRVVTGSVSTGGSVGFTTAFASQTPTGSVAISTVSGSAGATTLTTPQIPSHAHRMFGTEPFVGNPPGPGGIGFGPTRYPAGFSTFQATGNSTGTTANISTQTGAGQPVYQGSDNSGGGGDHTHPFSFSSGSGTFSGNAINLAVQYIDVIRATKD